MSKRLDALLTECIACGEDSPKVVVGIISKDGNGATDFARFIRGMIEKLPNFLKTKGECLKSKRDCGHHCNHSWTHDECCWCGKEWGEDIG
jgi:hypothetical protein